MQPTHYNCTGMNAESRMDGRAPPRYRALSSWSTTAARRVSAASSSTLWTLNPLWLMNEVYWVVHKRQISQLMLRLSWPDLDWIHATSPTERVMQRALYAYAILQAGPLLKMNERFLKSYHSPCGLQSVPSHGVWVQKCKCRSQILCTCFGMVLTFAILYFAREQTTLREGSTCETCRLSDDLFQP